MEGRLVRVVRILHHVIGAGVWMFLSVICLKVYQEVWAYDQGTLYAVMSLAFYWVTKEIVESVESTCQSKKELKLLRIKEEARKRVEGKKEMFEHLSKGGD